MTKIIAGGASTHLVNDIAKESGIIKIDVLVEKFHDQELHIELANGVNNEDIIIVQATSRPTNDNLMELLLLVDAAKRSGAKRVIAVIPYFGYSRQNRQTHPYGPISAQLVANIIEAAGVDHLLTIDMHSLEIKNFFKIGVTNIETTNLYASILKDFSEIVVASPDVGGLMRVHNLSELLRINFAVINKVRKRDGSCEMKGITGNVKGSHCVLIDDIIDTGTTLCQAAELLIQRGALSVEAIVTHAVISAQAEDKITNSVISKITVTNSIKQLNLGDKFKVIDIAPLITKNLKIILPNLE